MGKRLQFFFFVSSKHKSDILCYLQGSITGAYSSLTEEVTPSFILLAVQDTKVICYVYELVNGQVEVSKTEFSKKNTSEASTKVNSALMQSLLT